MQEINEALFLLINAPATPNAIILAIAKVLADQAIWLAPMALIVGWFRGSERTRKLMLEATASGLAGLLINQVIGLFGSIHAPSWWAWVTPLSRMWRTLPFPATT